MPHAKSLVEVSAGALRHNLAAIRHAVLLAAPPGEPQPAVLAVIKADAYGHSAVLCATVLARAGAEWLGVTDAAEGAAVREALANTGVRGEEQPQVLVMCGLERADAALVAEHRLTPVVWFREQMETLVAHGSADAPSPVHVEVDTGMARQGVRPGAELDALLAYLRGTPQLRLDGLMTHFASAEVAGSALTQAQAERFERAVDQVRAAGLRPRWLHAGNTSTLDEARLLHWLRAQASALRARLLLRTGLALYGYALPLEGAAGVLAPRLQPVAAWTTHIIGTQAIAPGETVGYNATFAATAPMRIALLPVGYADGLRRELSGTDAQGGGWVMVHGQRASIVGRVSMNLTTVDVTTIPQARVGDEVVLLGEGVSADDHAAFAKTIPYEILCGMRGRRVLVD